MQHAFPRAITTLGLAVAVVCAQAQQAQQAPYDLDLPAQPLSATLAALARQTGLQPVYTEEAIKGARSPEIKGRLTLREAVSRALSTSGLVFEFTADTSVAIKPAPSLAAAPAQLPTLEIRDTALVPPPAAPARDSYLRKQASVATKTDTPVLQTATKVEVLTPQILQDLGLQSRGMGQAMATLGIAGLGMGELGDVYFYRGFQTATTLWNGFRLEDIGSAASNGVNGPVWMNNIERMEMLRGASSILYGRAEPGGAINLITKKPRDTFGGAVDLGLGSHKDRWISADLGGPLNADQTLLFRLNVGHQQADSWYTYGHPYRSDGIAPALEFRFSPQTKAYFEGQFRDVEGGSDQPYIPLVPGTNTLMNVAPKDTLMPGTYSKFKQRRAMVGVDHQFNDDWSLTWKAMYNHADNPLTVLNWVIGMDYTDPANVQWNRGLTYNISGQKTHATLLELTGKATTGAIKHTLLFGADYYLQHSYQQAGGGTDPALYGWDWSTLYAYANPPLYSYNPADFQPWQDWHIQEREAALYAQDQIHLPHDVHLLVGGRFQRQVETVKDFVTPIPNQDVAYRRNQFLPRFSALWQPVSSLSLYYSYTENQGSSQGMDFNLKPIKPEHARQHEIGAKFELADRLMASVALFELTKQNIAGVDTAHPGFNVEVGRVKSTGYELSLQGAVTEQWNLLATYNHARPLVEVGTPAQDYGTGLVNNGLQPLDITAGTLLPYVSTRTFSLLTSYRLPVDGLQGWKVGGGYNWFSAATLDQNSTVPTRAYGVASAFVAYDTRFIGRKVTVQLNVDNLFDKHYLQYQGDTGAWNPSNYVGGNWGAPRTVKLNLRTEF